MAKDLILDPILASLAQTWAPQFFLQVLFLLVFRHSSKLSSYAIPRKTNEPNLRKWQKPNSGPDFGLFYPKCSSQLFFFVGFTSTRCEKLLEVIIICNFKEN